MKLEEVMHLYLGATVRIDFGPYGAPFTGRKFGDYIMTRCDKQGKIDLMAVGTGVSMQYNWRQEDMKIVLRRLEDMSEEEAKEICSLIDEPFIGLFSYKDKVCLNIKSTLYGDKKDRSFYIHNNGNLALFYNDGNWGGSGFDQIKNSFEVFKYLLSKGFDLFGLIDSGAALDSKTLNR